ncbi:cation channel sperm-associated auxiliary subunit delta-like, partial [Petaurus breviceps papuanus]|uniref:cation channel sperm-associated auxiliary subunit delta-like n=1 Tax=Petaurus breviceps papuanus TaxID=3040969 RepID=UPI0036DACD4C
VGTPAVSSAIFSLTSILLVIHGHIYGYDYKYEAWLDILVEEESVTDIFAENCCYSNSFACTAISQLVVAYNAGVPLSQANLYVSDNMGFEFSRLYLPNLEHLKGTLEGFFYFHTMSKFAFLMKDDVMVSFSLIGKIDLNWTGVK